MLKLGIDDAGRGPIIGPMVLAGVLIEEETESSFKEQGIKDSKMLSPSKREELAEKIKEQALDYCIVQLEPSEIDGGINGGTNLNTLEAIECAKIINKINKNTVQIKVVIDCPSPNIKAWIETVRGYVENTSNLEIIGEHKADVNHPSVSAASILAKTHRDSEIEKLKEKLGVDFGSGYPSDPYTCKFLKESAKKHEHSGIFRKTWGTWKKLCLKQKSLGEF